MPLVSDEFDTYTEGSPINMDPPWSTLFQHNTTLDAFTAVRVNEDGRVHLEFDPASVCDTGLAGYEPPDAITPAVSGTVAAYRQRVFSGLTPGGAYKMQVKMRHRGIRVEQDALHCPGNQLVSRPIPSFVVYNDVTSRTLEGEIGPTGVGVGGDYTQPEQILLTDVISARGDGTLSVAVGWYNLRAVIAIFWDVDYIRFIPIDYRQNYVYTI